MGKLTFALATIICLFRPCEASADEEVDAGRRPRMGLELQNYWAGSTWWQEGFRGGFDTNTNLGLGILEKHCGLMLRAGIGATTSRVLAGEHLQSRFNLEALVWMHWQAEGNSDAYFAAGNALQYTESARNQTWNLGVTAELGWDIFIFRWVSMRYALKAHLFPDGSFDAGIVINSMFFSWPL